MKPTDSATAWKKSTAMERAAMCKAFLAIHGFLSDAENERVGVRLLKWVRKHKPAK